MDETDIPARPWRDARLEPGGAADRSRRRHARPNKPAGFDARPLFSVLEGLAESFSGGVPWVALTAEQRDTVTWVLRQLA